MDGHFGLEGGNNWNWYSDLNSRLLAASTTVSVLFPNQKPCYLREREILFGTSTLRHSGNEGQSREPRRIPRPTVPLDRVSPEVRDLVEAARQFRDDLVEWLKSDQPGDWGGLEEEIFRQENG